MKAYVLSPILFATIFLNTTPSFAEQHVPKITQLEVEAQQQKWCNSLVAISQTYLKDGQLAAKKMASDVLDDQYGYKDNTVLFKPTLSQKPQTFRTTKEGALAYFVANDEKFPNDTGFALKGWQKCSVENDAFNISNDYALVMGKVYLEDGKGKITTVDKTWGFVKDKNSKLKIVVHHSSLEYQPS
ncbi:hypothetical protein [Acinetobacter boissieri]|uniref:Phosphoribosyl-AMP cyclohydrolase n=1 Tax=Acinetobacter boissieri TaxID=1219383 RepID=A0A1G6H882_9GAMM|nr:hypothetical protein [Acinetobacter boissieri]SDB90298.1 hypothetical protein SAMN05421733_104127 [Acinetobacter boissieri]